MTELDGATPSELLEEFGGDLTEMSERELDAIVAADENRDTPEILTGAAGDAYSELHRRTAEARKMEQAKANRAMLAELAELQRAVEEAEKDTSRPAPTEATGDLGDWLRDTPWAEVLLPAGFLQDGSDSQCGCDTWTAPGVHDSSKSAVTHDEDCRKFDQSDGGRLHIWTDNPSTSSPMDDAVADGRRDFSKLQALALLAHGGDELAAMDAENIDRDTVASYGRELAMAKPSAKAVDEMEGWVLDNLLDRQGVEDVRPPEPLISGWLDLDTTAAIIGAAGSWKSFHLIDMACCIATGRDYHGAAVTQGPVVIAVGEGMAGIKLRLKAWEMVFNDGEPVKDLYILRSPFNIAKGDAAKVAAFTRVMERMKPHLVAFDTLARYTSGVSDSSDDDMKAVVSNLDTIREATGCCAMVIHHTTRGTSHGRGSTALIGAWDSEYLAEQAKDMEGVLKCTKSKHHEDGWERPITTSVVVVDDDGNDSLVVQHEGDTGLSSDGPVFFRPQPLGHGPKSALFHVLAACLHETFRGNYAAYGEIQRAVMARPRFTNINQFYSSWALLGKKGWLDENPAKPNQWRLTDAARQEMRLPDPDD